MNKKFNIILVLLLAVVGIAFTACEDDDKNDSAKAVLANVFSLQFDAKDNPSVKIEVVSDARWTVDAPDWVTVEPNTGSGETDVVITVADNVDAQGELNPRECDIVFHGDTKASEFPITIYQGGDLFRGIQPTSDVAVVDDAANKTAVIVQNMTVAHKLAAGFMVTNGTRNMYVASAADDIPAVGSVVTVYGSKATSELGVAIVNLDHTVAGSGQAAELPEAKDIQGSIDTYAGAPRELVTFVGAYEAGVITVEGAKKTVNVLETSSDFDLAPLNVHNIKVTGYFSGANDNVMGLVAVAAEDLGANETRYWEDDFEWLDPWAAGAKVGRTVETDDLDATATALTSIEADGMSCFDFVESKGYKFVYDKNDNKRIYLQQNYLKFGKTGNHAGITLPSITTVPEGQTVALVFDWCPMRQGSGKIDPVNLYLIVSQGGEEKEINIPTHGWENDHKLEWIRAEVRDLTITPTTQITITQREWEVGTANRWFLDNIRVVKQ